jgi:hypothetical protein
MKENDLTPASRNKSRCKQPFERTMGGALGATKVMAVKRKLLHLLELEPQPSMQYPYTLLMEVLLFQFHTLVLSYLTEVGH